MSKVIARPVWRQGRRSLPLEKKRTTFQIGLIPAEVEIVNKLYPEDCYSFSRKVSMLIEWAGGQGCDSCKFKKELQEKKLLLDKIKSII
jgi:hypothetical protein